jgi:hypothetical protein
MNSNFKIHIKTILDVVIYVSFYTIIWLTTWNLTLGFVKQKELLNVIQMKNVQILALATACKMDWLIKQRRPDLREVE